MIGKPSSKFTSCASFGLEELPPSICMAWVCLQYKLAENLICVTAIFYLFDREWNSRSLRSLCAWGWPDFMEFDWLVWFSWPNAWYTSMLCHVVCDMQDHMLGHVLGHMLGHILDHLFSQFPGNIISHKLGYMLSHILGPKLGHML